MLLTRFFLVAQELESDILKERVEKVGDAGRELFMDLDKKEKKKRRKKESAEGGDKDQDPVKVKRKKLKDKDGKVKKKDKEGECWSQQKSEILFFGKNKPRGGQTQRRANCGFPAPSEADCALEFSSAQRSCSNSLLS